MGAPSYSAADFLGALRALMPTGRVWPASPDAIQSQALAGFAPSFERSSDAAGGLLVDSFPATATNLLPEWEETLGLPDPCAGEAPTLQTRRQQVVAKLTALGGQSATYFIGLAATLGYTITIVNRCARRYRGTMGGLYGGDPWSYTWEVHSPLTSLSRRTYGQSAYGEPYATWQNTVLECVINEYAPAHTLVTFIYS